jgi:protein-S-isoprenylcysteine O-methyltransferase Ste14
MSAPVRRANSILGSFVFLLLAPGVVAGLVPWWMTQGEFRRSSFSFGALRIVGLVLIVAGGAALLDSFARFAVEGSGTPAPLLPAKYLVVTGLYRYLRNPMYVAVAAVIFGQALFFGSTHLVEYGLTVVVLVHIFVVFYEEPSLTRTFGDQYREYCRNVRRWIPRLRPWSRSRTQAAA